MRTDFEPVLTGLLNHLAAKVKRTFTGDTSEGSADISNVSDFTGLFVGIGVYGPGIPRNTTIDSMDTNAGTITMSGQAEADGTGASFTAGFLTVSRRTKKWEDVEDQPAMFLRHPADEDDFPEDQILSVTTLEVELWIYSRAGEDPNFPPDVALNTLIATIRRAMAPDDNHQFRFTIGGLCHWCRIEGRTERDDGTLDKQSKALVPIKITLP